MIQNGIVLGADDGVAGGIGTVDDTFAQLGRIVPISGDFPTQSDEIAMTTTLLDALGCSYDVGQTVTLKVAANDYDPLAGSGAVMEKAYTLCGVLPAYDVYWNLNGNLTVSGIVSRAACLGRAKVPDVLLPECSRTRDRFDRPCFSGKRVCLPAGGYRFIFFALFTGRSDSWSAFLQWRSIS